MDDIAKNNLLLANSIYSLLDQASKSTIGSEDCNKYLLLYLSEMSYLSQNEEVEESIIINPNFGEYINEALKNDLNNQELQFNQSEIKLNLDLGNIEDKDISIDDQENQTRPVEEDDKKSLFGEITDLLKSMKSSKDISILSTVTHTEDISKLINHNMNIDALQFYMKYGNF